MGGPDVRVHFIMFYDLGRNFGESTGSILLAGGMAGIFSWVFTYPQDVLKSRLQADSFTRPRYSGTWDCVVQSYNRDGARVFCRGECRAHSRQWKHNHSVPRLHSHVVTSFPAEWSNVPWLRILNEVVSSSERVTHRSLVMVTMMLNLDLCYIRLIYL